MASSRGLMDHTVGIYEYSTKDLIGHGAFAVVYKGRLKMRPNQPVAIKAIAKKNLAKSQNLLGKEIKILKELTELHHDNVVALLDCKETPNHVYLVMEYCNGGDLADYLNAKGTLSEDTIKIFLRQLAGAISAMVSKDIVHRDLKPQNILLSHDGKSRNPQPQDIKLKVADFGFARFLQDGVMAATLCGSPMYMAPEVIMSLQYNSKADLWSLGTIVFQCLTGKAPFQAQTPQALKHFYEKNAKLAPKIPAGTSPELTDLLNGLLKRDAKDRLGFEVFFHHTFLRSETSSSAATAQKKKPPQPQEVVSRTKSAPVAKPIRATATGATPRTTTTVVAHKEVKQQQQHHPPMEEVAVAKNQSPEQTNPEGFVMVPKQLAMDSAEQYNKGSRPSPHLRRHGGAASPNPRPISLPVNLQEPIPVPSQKANFQQMVRSRTKSGDSITSAMSGVSSASGGSTLGPLPEEGIAPLRPRAASMSSPTSSPKITTSTKSRRISAPPIPDISQMSPPTLQYTMGATPPQRYRRRTSSSSSCGTPPPTSAMWTVSPNQPSPMRPATSPSRSARNSGGSIKGAENIPCLSPILGSPTNKNDLQQQHQLVHANTVPENMSSFCAGQPQEDNFRRRSAEMQMASGRNVVLNYGSAAAAAANLFERNSPLGRRNSGGAGKENIFQLDFPMQPPPALSEETLLAPEHNEVLAKLKFIHQYVDTVIDVARCKAAPLSVLSESSVVAASAALTAGAAGGNDPDKKPQLTDWDPNSPLHRRVQQLLLYMRCLHLLSQALDFSRNELKAKRLKPSTSVKSVLATLNERFRHCLSMAKMLNSENILNECGLDAQSSANHADRILYHYAIEQCQSAALDELFGNPGECFQRYHGAHILLHALEHQAKTSEEKQALNKYRDAVEKRLAILADQGFVTAYQTLST